MELTVKMALGISSTDVDPPFVRCAGLKVVFRTGLLPERQPSKVQTSC